MADKLTKNGKDELNKFLGQVQDSLLSTITPELLRDGIERIKKANIDGDKSLSRKEVVAYLADNLNDSPPDQATKGNIEFACNMVAIHTHIPKPEEIIRLEKALIDFSDGTMVSVGITKEISESLKSPSKKQELTDKFSSIAFEITGTNLSVPPAYQQAASEFMTPKIQEIGKKTTKEIEGLLKAHPDIKRALQNLPDASEIDNINAEHVCQALTEPHTTRKVQTTKITR